MMIWKSWYLERNLHIVNKTSDQTKKLLLKINVPGFHLEYMK